MSFFSPLFKDKNKKYDEQKRNSIYTQTFIYILVAGYVLYLYKQILEDYIAKISGMSVTGFTLASIFMVGGSLFLIVFALITLPKALLKTELPPEDSTEVIIDEAAENDGGETND